MAYRITDMNKDGQAFVMDELDRRMYYKHSLGVPLRLTRLEDFSVRNVSGFSLDPVTGEDGYWYDQKGFGKIKFDSREEVDEYIDAVARSELVKLVRRISSSRAA